MGLRINTNVMSLQAQNRLFQTGKRLSGTLERLSTGLRINKGSDDVVGLLKSESLRSQINGIGASKLNLSNAQSLLGVAEGSLAQLTELAQSVRTLTVQASDDTISATDRDNLNTAIADLVAEYSRIAAASEFDGVKLLTGTFTNKTFQIGPQASDALAFSISDARSASIGRVAVLTSISVTVTAINTTGTVDLSNPSGIVINNVTVTVDKFTADGVSNIQTSESAIAYVNAINSFSSQTKVTAQILSNVVTLSTYSGTDDIDSGHVILINGITIANSSGYASDTTGSASFVSAINDQSTQTGISAAVNATASAIVLTASDGRNIHVRVNADDGSFSGIMGLQYGGSNDGAAVYRGTFRLFSDTSFTLAGASQEIAGTATTVSTSATTTLDNLNVDTSANAQTGIFILDNVIRQLQTRRSDIGSKSIRLGVGESELRTREENLKSAESRIRDADIATETADLTAAQILQQAGVSVLARANSIPQIALSLLQG